MQILNFRKYRFIFKLSIIVSPIYKTHHHYRHPILIILEIFSQIWDRLFGTQDPFDREKLVYGVDVFFDEEGIGNL